MQCVFKWSSEAMRKKSENGNFSISNGISIFFILFDAIFPSQQRFDAKIKKKNVQEESAIHQILSNR